MKVSEKIDEICATWGLISIHQGGPPTPLKYIDDYQYIQEIADKNLLTTEDVTKIIKAVSIE